MVSAALWEGGIKICSSSCSSCPQRYALWALWLSWGTQGQAPVCSLPQHRTKFQWGDGSGTVAAQYCISKLSVSSVLCASWHQAFAVSRFSVTGSDSQIPWAQWREVKGTCSARQMSRQDPSCHIIQCCLDSACLKAQELGLRSPLFVLGFFFLFISLCMFRLGRVGKGYSEELYYQVLV